MVKRTISSVCLVEHVFQLGSVRHSLLRAEKASAMTPLWSQSSQSLPRGLFGQPMTNRRTPYHLFLQYEIKKTVRMKAT